MGVWASVGRHFSWFKVPIKLATTNLLFGPCCSPCGPPDGVKIVQGYVNKGGKSLDSVDHFLTACSTGSVGTCMPSAAYLRNPPPAHSARQGNKGDHGKVLIHSFYLLLRKRLRSACGHGSSRGTYSHSFNRKQETKIK